MGRPAAATYAAFAGAAAVGGSNYVAISITVAEMAPLFAAAFRFGIGTVLFLLVLALRRPRLPEGREWAGVIGYGALAFGGAYAFRNYSLTGLTAGEGALVVATIPVFTLILAVMFGQERITGRGIAAMLLALAGIAVLARGTFTGGTSGPFLLAAALGTISLAGGSVVAREHRSVDPLWMNAGGMAAGTLLLATASLVFGESWALPKGPGTLAAMAWLATVGTVGLFQLFLYVVDRWKASAAVYAMAAMPIFAVLLGAPLLGEEITAAVVGGGALVMAGVVAGASSGASQTRIA